MMIKVSAILGLIITLAILGWIIYRNLDDKPEISPYQVIGGVCAILIISSILIGYNYRTISENDRHSSSSILKQYMQQTNRTDDYIRQYGVSNTSWQTINHISSVRQNWSPINSKNPTRSMWEFSNSQDPRKAIDQSDVQQAWELYSATWNTVVTNNWTNISEARHDGYYQSPRKGDHIHYPNKVYLTDDTGAEVEKPGFLMFTPNTDPPTLLGVMFFAKDLESKIPFAENPIIIPHIHIWNQAFCYTEEVMRQKTECPQENVGRMSLFSPEMFHVWFVPEKTGGPFATSMFVEQKNLYNTPDKLTRTEFVDRLEEQFNITVGKR